MDAFRRRQNTERRLYAIFARRYDIVLATFARRFDIVLALCVRADGGKFRFSRHMGQRERESDGGVRAPDPALRGWRPVISHFFIGTFKEDQVGCKRLSGPQSERGYGLCIFGPPRERA